MVRIRMIWHPREDDAMASQQHDGSRSDVQGLARETRFAQKHLPSLIAP